MLAASARYSVLYLQRRDLSLAYKNYYTSKDGVKSREPVVILHGLFGSKQNWNSICKALQKKLPAFPIIAIDLRNHGESPHSNEMSYPLMAQDLVETLPQIVPDRDRAIFVGHSMGGKVVAALALSKPSIVSKLLISDMSIRTHIATSTKDLISAMREVNFPINMSTVAARNMADVHLAKTVEDVSLRQFLLTNLANEGGRIVWRVNLEAIDRCFDHLSDFPSKLLENTYDGPTLVCKGDKSNYVREKDEENYRQHFPRVIIRTIANAGHWIHADNPNAFMKTVVEFVNE